MALNKTLFVSSIINFFESLMFSCFIDPLLEFQQFYSKFLFYVNTHIGLLVPKVSLHHNEVRDLETQKGCKYCREYEGFLTGNEIDTVMDKLGLEQIDEENACQKETKCRKCWVLEGASLFLEEKEASAEELEEAFSVFDQNKDGCLDAIELHHVLNMLELKEGAKLEDCEEMIRAYDLNGDGRIDLSEFKHMLENAT